MFGKDANAKNAELQKLLALSGVDPNEPMDPKLQKKLFDIVNNFDPNKKTTDEDKAFALQHAKFNNNKKKVREERQTTDKKAEKSFLTNLAMSNKIKKDITVVAADIDKRRSA
jgi:hypothetical protein